MIRSSRPALRAAEITLSEHLEGQIGALTSDPRTGFIARHIIGLLDDALLVDVALQNLRGELADYESFCHFRQVAADFAGIDARETGLGRDEWLEALQQAQRSHHGWGTPAAPRFAPVDARATLFHIV